MMQRPEGLGKATHGRVCWSAHHSGRLGSKVLESQTKRIRRQRPRARTLDTEAAGGRHLCVDVMKCWQWDSHRSSLCSCRRRRDVWTNTESYVLPSMRGNFTVKYRRCHAVGNFRIAAKASSPSHADGLERSYPWSARHQTYVSCSAHTL